MKNKLILMSLVLVAAIQLMVPLSMIYRREGTLKEGKMFKFHTAPVDPYDPFRGKYVALRLAAEREPLAVKNARALVGKKVHVLLEEDEDGFATLAGISKKRPENRAYLDCKVRRAGNNNRVYVDLPFDRYYMEEGDAPKAESAYWRNSRDRRDAYITVRVKSGFGVLEKLYIQGMPVEEFLRQKPEKADDESQ